MIRCKKCSCTGFSVDTKSTYNVRIDVDTSDEDFIIQHDVGDYESGGIDLRNRWYCYDCGQPTTEEQSSVLWQRYLFDNVKVK